MFFSFEESPMTEQTKVFKNKWTKEEDDRLVEIVQQNGPSNWNHIATFIKGRNGKQCRERWLSALSPDVSHKDWTPKEDIILRHYQGLIGNKWSMIVKYLPGRTAIAAKNRFKLLARKDLVATYSHNLMQPVAPQPTYVEPVSSPETDANEAIDDFNFDVFREFTLFE